MCDFNFDMPMQIVINNDSYMSISKTSSKGNQRKWKNKVTGEFVKEQFFYQGKYWKDWMVEVLASNIASQLNIKTPVLEQKHVQIIDNGNVTDGVVSENMVNDGSMIVTYQRLCDMHNLDVEDMTKAFPLEIFNSIKSKVAKMCNIDITDYLIDMCLLDFILLNEDRHYNNISVVYSSVLQSYRVCTLYDFGIGLFAHDKRYTGKTLSQALTRTECKPFHSEPEAIINALMNSEYREMLVKRIPSNIHVSDSMIPNDLAKEWLDYAINKLLKLR